MKIIREDHRNHVMHYDVMRDAGWDGYMQVPMPDPQLAIWNLKVRLYEDIRTDWIQRNDVD